jgi:hypothetical protein
MNKQTFGLAVTALIRYANADLPHFERTNRILNGPYRTMYGPYRTIRDPNRVTT